MYAFIINVHFVIYVKGATLLKSHEKIINLAKERHLLVSYNIVFSFELWLH